jgi:hypothetical protein
MVKSGGKPKVPFRKGGKQPKPEVGGILHRHF